MLLPPIPHSQESSNSFSISTFRHPRLRSILFTMALVLISCSATHRPDSPPMFATPTGRRLVKNHTLLNIRPSLHTYLDAQYQRFSAQPSASVLMFQDNEPFALLIDASRVAISCGLIALTAHDADLAFVLAHEAAHLTLKHYLLDRPGAREELQADDIALRTLVSAGYRTENTYKLFTELYTRTEHLNQEYPSTRERLYQFWSIRERLNQHGSPTILTPSRHLTDLKTACRDQK